MATKAKSTKAEPAIIDVTAEQPAAAPVESGTKKAVRMAFGHEGSVMIWAATDKNGKKYDARLDVSKVPEELYEVARDHGFKQKVADSAAKSVDTSTGASAAMAEKFDAMIRTIQNLYEGRWNAVREGGNLAILVEAICRVRGITAEKAKAWLEKLPDDQVSQLYRNARIIEASAAIRAERARNNPEAQAVADELLNSIPD